MVLERDGYRCRACGHPGGPFECDHVVPLHKDRHQDPYDPDGCQTLCEPCHMAKTRGENCRPPTVEETKWRRFIAKIAEGA